MTPRVHTRRLRTLRSARLVFSSDQEPGIGRLQVRSSFRYVSAAGRPIRSARVLTRVRRLVIPPAWTDVWISPSPHGHIQAIGRDQRGRKQYVYHPAWREHRDQVKYDRLATFAERLGMLNRQVERDLRRPGLSRHKVVATIVRLLQTTLIRIGNSSYARDNGSFGLTTLLDDHVEVRGPRVRFRFRGKSGVRHEVDLHDRRLARVIKACQDLPGQELFRFEGRDRKSHIVKSEDVNRYLRKAMGQDFTAKDFRTWAGTVLAARTLFELGDAASVTEAKRNVVRAVDCVAERLGNTRSVCRKCYIHPGILSAYVEGRLRGVMSPAPRRRRRLAHLSREEAAVVTYLSAARARD